jgi:hypothetical protein
MKYRMLKKGEIIRKGDEFFSNRSDPSRQIWIKVESDHITVVRIGTKFSDGLQPYRRPIAGPVAGAKKVVNDKKVRKTDGRS